MNIIYVCWRCQVKRRQTATHQRWKLFPIAVRSKPGNSFAQLCASACDPVWLANIFYSYSVNLFSIGLARWPMDVKIFVVFIFSVPADSFIKIERYSLSLFVLLHWCWSSLRSCRFDNLLLANSNPAIKKRNSRKTTRVKQIPFSSFAFYSFD